MHNARIGLALGNNTVLLPGNQKKAGINLNSRNAYATDSPAPIGMVTSHDAAISFTTSVLTLLSPRASPTPMTAPTSVCVAEMGRPRREAMTTTVAAENSAAKPRVGVSSVIRWPMVAMTR